jgi:hypothetical protein
MACYISSNNERVYTAVESSFGSAAAVTAAHRIPAVKFSARQRMERAQRRDKTGSRTFAGDPAGLRRQTEFLLRTYLTSWQNPGAAPAYGPLFQGVMGGRPEFFGGGVTASGTTATQIKFAAAHGLDIGRAITFAGEIRFVTGVIDNQTVVLNRGFSSVPSTGSLIGPAVTYRPATDLPSVSLYDYWEPSTALQRIVTGGVVNQMQLTINGDFHEFEFSGPAKDLIDNATYEGGMAGYTSFPQEPAVGNFDYSIVPGHLGQAFLGAVPTQFLTITTATLKIDNSVDLRDQEFGAGPGALCSVAGERRVSLEFSLYERDDAATQALYQAARQRSPISVMFQLGQQSGQLFGVMMTGVIPELPEFDDSETRLKWNFADSRAQGVADDEIFIAFG